MERRCPGAQETHRSNLYRRAHNLGDGAAAGVGLGDEFVLVDVKVTPATAAVATARPSQPSAAVTSASATPATCADRGVAYRITGSDEEKLKELVGRQLEIQGRFKDAEDAATAGARAADRIPAEIVMVSFSEAPSAAPMSEPMAATPPPVTPTPPVATVETPRTPIPAPVADPAPAPRRELPRTAGSSVVLGLIGVLALSSGVALTSWRRRAH